jgi:hypothetical protein
MVITILQTIKQDKHLMGLIYLVVIGIVVVVNMFIYWAEMGEVLKYILIRLPLSIMMVVYGLRVFSESMSNPRKIFGFIGLMFGIFLMLPPFIIYKLFIM